MMSNSASRSTGALFDKGLDMRAVCRMALAPPTSGVNNLTFALVTNYMAKKLQLVLCKHALGLFEVQLVVVKQSKDNFQVLDMQIHSRTVDKYTIQENHHTLAQKRSHNMIHKLLECGRGSC